MAQRTPPVHIEILSPLNGTLVYKPFSVNLRASARAGKKDLDSKIRWRSSLDGFLGQGGDIHVELTEGEHILTARARHSKATPGQQSRTKSKNDSDDSDETAKDSVTVKTVPVDYSGGDT